jgi:hypothetical protein
VNRRRITVYELLCWDGVVGVVKFNDVPVIFPLTVKFVMFITPDTVTPVIFPPVSFPVRFCASTEVTPIAAVNAKMTAAKIGKIKMISFLIIISQRTISNKR